MRRIKTTKATAGVSLLAIVLLLGSYAGRAGSQPLKTYAGSAACRDCHEAEYESFSKYAKKARSYESVVKMKDGLTEAEYSQCLQCHATGYGKPGGFRSVEETPHLKNAGCEVCHGPGGLHIETEEPEDIKRRPTTRDCDVCHSEERVEAFDYKPLIHGGAH